MYVEIANSKVPIKMAQVVATIKIMPENPESDLSSIQDSAEEEIKNFQEKHKLRQSRSQ